LISSMRTSFAQNRRIDLGEQTSFIGDSHMHDCLGLTHRYHSRKNCRFIHSKWKI